MDRGTNGKNTSVTVVCGHASDVSIRLAQMAPEAPMLGKIGETLGAAPPAVLVRFDIILGSSIRVA